MIDRRQEVVNVYKRVLKIVFERLSPTFGQRTIGAIAKNVVARQAKKYKILQHLKVSELGMDWEEFETNMSKTPEDEVSTALEVFLDDLFDAISSLIGRLIVGKLFKEAEEEAKRGDEV